MSSRPNLRASFAAVVFFPILLIACGGDDSVDADKPVPTATAESDAAPARYVDDVCTAAAKMFTAYQKSFQDNRESLGGMDPTDAYARTARVPFAVLITDLEQLTPPAEAANSHAETIRQAKEVLEALKQGDRQKLLGLRGTPDTGVWKQVIDLSPELKDRYGQASLEVQSCRELAA
ncbi:MAG: hypothetical protein IH609_11170, partial [Dehalococcoidia bacterium]|nr:hypothetical protein [Dehalococcoidia bacterium]